MSWLPYVLDRMDHEYEDRFYHLNLSMKPREFWLRQGFSTYQKETIDPGMVPLMGEDNIIWGSDYPHPDGVGPIPWRRLRRTWQACPPGLGRRSRARMRVSFTGLLSSEGFVPPPESVR